VRRNLSDRVPDGTTLVWKKVSEESARKVHKEKKIGWELTLTIGEGR